MPLVKPAPLRLLFQGSCGKYDVAIMIHICKLSLPLVSVSADAETNKMMAAVFCYGGVVLESGGDWWPINNAKRRHKSAIKVRRTRQYCMNPMLVSRANAGKWGQQRPGLFLAAYKVLMGYKWY